MSQSSVSLVEFNSQSATLRGKLYLPDTHLSKSPVVLMAMGFTATISGMTADKYAIEFQKAGFAVLLYDHRNFGISDGEPRQEINFWVQSRGYIDALDYLFTRSDIDTSRIAIWGASLSAKEAFLVAAVDERVNAVISIIPAFGDDSPDMSKSNEIFTHAKRVLQSERIMELSQTPSETVPVVSPDQLNAPSALKELTAYRWFIEYGGRFGTNWRNLVSRSNVEELVSFHIGHFASELKTPVLLVVATNDEMRGASTAITKEVFDLINSPKEWVDVDGGHFGLLHYPSSIFDKSSQAQVSFLKRTFN